MKPTIWIFSLEPIESRYTIEWHTHIPALLEQQLGDRFRVAQIDGIQKNSQTTPGAFLNFSDTNYWKSSQLCAFLDFVNQGQVSTHDHLIFADAWNPVILQIKYMKDLLSMNWTVHGLWHAGSWDSQDFLGRLIGDAEWVRHCEKSMYHAVDHNYFATMFHIDLFWRTLFVDQFETENVMRLQDAIGDKKIVQCGWPFEYLPEKLSQCHRTPKQDLILFPHRIAPEKQVEIFKDLAHHLPQYQWAVCQEQQLTKMQYHQLLAQSKMVFSANLQETLGISTCAEASLSLSLPFAPNRLSYSEIFNNHQEFLYPSEWTENWQLYQTHKTKLIERLVWMMNNYSQLVDRMAHYNASVVSKYFCADKIISTIAKSENQ
jgi:hypothetical protein